MLSGMRPWFAARHPALRRQSPASETGMLIYQRYRSPFDRCVILIGDEFILRQRGEFGNCSAATLGRNTARSHALITNWPESRLHFQASGTFGRFSALVRPKPSTPRSIASAPSPGDGAG